MAIQGSTLASTYEKVTSEIEYLINYWNANLLTPELQYKGVVIGSSDNISDDCLYVNITEIQYEVINGTTWNGSWSFFGNVQRANIPNILVNNMQYDRTFFEKITDTTTNNYVQLSKSFLYSPLMNKTATTIEAPIIGTIYGLTLGERTKLNK